MTNQTGTAPSALRQFRERFPSLADSVHLASCSQGALSTDLNAALFELQYTMREYGAPWDRWTAEVERARGAFAELVNAEPSEVAVLSCASEGAYQVASSRRWSTRPRIVTTDMEFPSVAHVWLAQESRGAEVVHVPDRDGLVVAEDYGAAIDERAGLVSIPLVSYRNGARMPVVDAVAAARAAGAKVFVDGYQACGVLPVDVRELDCDFFVSGALKYMLGLPGIAFLYVRGGIDDEAPQQLTGWFGQQNPFEFDPRKLEPAPDARRFQTGTPAIPSAYAATAGLTALGSITTDLVENRVGDLVDETHQTLTADGEQLWSPADPSLRGPMVAIVDENPNRMADFLASRRINTSPRGHVLRLSFHGYNDRSDVSTVCEAIRDYRKS